MPASLLRSQFDTLEEPEPDEPGVVTVDAGGSADEEVAEVRAELPAAHQDRLRDEVGDLLFVLANLARKLDLDPETCLRHANDKFSRRFNGIEQAAAIEGKSLAEMSLEEMEQEWQKIKRNQPSPPSWPSMTRPSPRDDR